MKVAHLIIAHNNIEHLERLINRLKVKDCDIFICIDGRCNIKDFVFLEDDNVKFIESKIKIFWGGFSLVQATINLLMHALLNSDAQRFQLLSGNDYPIKSLDEYYTFLDKNTHMEFITVGTEITPSSDLYYRVSNFFYMDADISNNRTRNNYRNISGEIKELLDSIFTDDVLMRHNNVVSSFMDEYRIYKGSNWFNISREAASYCIDFISKHRTFVDFFRHTQCSDEMFFQTIFKNSYLSTKICKDFTEKDRNPNYKLFSGLHYVNWKAMPTPKIFKTIDDLDELRLTESFFARKFDTHSEPLLDLIDKELINK